MNINQDETDIKMQEELDIIAGMLQKKSYNDYYKYEDDVAKLINTYCPVCKSEINNTTIGIFVLLGNIRNYIRTKANIQFI
jgi:predicted RecB family nuclease